MYAVAVHSQTEILAEETEREHTCETLRTPSRPQGHYISNYVVSEAELRGYFTNGGGEAVNLGDRAAERPHRKLPARGSRKQLRFRLGSREPPELLRPFVRARVVTTF